MDDEEEDQDVSVRLCFQFFFKKEAGTIHQVFG